MKQKLVVLVVIFCSLRPVSARGDLFGGDVAVLSQILVNAVQQLAQLRDILGSGQDTLRLFRDVYQGINDALNLLRTVSPDTDPGIYRDWDQVNDALRKLEETYGPVADSKDAAVQKDTDQSVAEAVTLNNDIYKYTKDIDQIGEEVKAASHTASPVGAQKLTVQTLGVMLHVMNQSLRTQATGLKLQAESMALANKREKDGSRHFLESTNALSHDMKKEKPTFSLPEFQ